MFMAWLKGFQSRQTFTPNCTVCGGTGAHKAKSVWTNAEHEGKTGYEDCEFRCNCNVSSS
ncbi:MAG TPA: hypothetical protein DDW52_10385 [Planctomycetaceae bacterium]|nr:hypothetical protein [Planctomycetaceae bacterium]